MDKKRKKIIVERAASALGSAKKNKAYTHHTPVKLHMTFEEAVDLAACTSIKKSHKKNNKSH